MAKQTIFLTGATGYVGGSVLWRLFNHKDAANFNLKVLVRDPAKARTLKEKFGIDAIVGSHKDADKLETLASEADFVFAIADSDDLTAVNAVLKGAKKFKERTGKTPVLIHTSGTAVVADNAAGMYEAEKVYDDSKVADIESLAPTQPHRHVDVAVAAADVEGYVKTYIVVPSTIYGMPKNGFTEAGLQNIHSIQVPQVIRAGLGRGQGGMVGLGKNKWANVHIDDVADLYTVLFDKVKSDPENTPHGREGYYFGVAGEHTLYDLYKAIAEALVALGIGKSSEPTKFTQEDLDKYFGGSDYMGTNARCIANRSFSIGWKPKRGTADLLASVRLELESLL